MGQLIARRWTLPAQPILRAEHVSALTGAKSSAAHDAINQLQAAGVLEQISVGKRNRAFEAAGLLNLIDEFERTLAIPEPKGEKPVRQHHLSTECGAGAQANRQ